MQAKAIIGTIIIVGACIFLYHTRTKKIPPQEYESQFKKACQLLIDKKNDQAIQLFKALAYSNDQYPAVFFNLGRAYANNNEWYKALESYGSALNLESNIKHLIYFHRGLVRYNMQEYESAKEQLMAALHIQPNYAECLHLLGTIAQQQFENEPAAQYLIKAAKLNKTYIQKLLSVAHDLRNEKKFESAYSCAATAIEVDPEGANSYYAYLMLADLENMQANTQNAMNYYQKACQANPDCHEAFNNLGTLYACQYGDLKNAQKYLEAALAIKPDHAGTRTGLSALHLVQGDYEKGWQEYECRLEKFFERNPRHYTKPRWNGTESLMNKTIILQAEQGMGDTLQFIRFAQLLKNNGAKIIVEVQKPLRHIVALCPYIDAVITPGQPWPEHDLYIHLMSLPYVLKTRLNSIPSKIPYVYADQKLSAAWRSKLASDCNFKIGICWHVEPSHDAEVFRGENGQISIAGCKRSIPLQDLLPLAKMNGVSVYSLQKNNGLDDFTKINNQGLIKDFGSDFDTTHGSFMDTAAIMQQLDLVITADTSVAHLAGALGVPVWVLLPFPADWRWLLDREDTPWYPTMKLFRKRLEDKDWHRVVNTVKAALQVELEKRKRKP